MHELDEELWKLGVSAKTEHNEVAPAQHELAPIYTTVNIAADHNQLTMEMMKKVAQPARHGVPAARKALCGRQRLGQAQQLVACPPIPGVNLLEPGDTPQRERAVSAVPRARCCRPWTIIRTCCASPWPARATITAWAPAKRRRPLCRVFLGDELTGILEAIENDTPTWARRKKSCCASACMSLPRFPRDTTDRNRTSPFAFTGNKFEFRSVGSPMSISGCNIVLNTAVAESLRQYANDPGKGR